MMHASDIAHELYVRDNAQNVRISEEYAHWMRIATPVLCVFGNNPELHLIAPRYSLDVAVFQASPDNPHKYMLTQTIVVDPKNHDNVI